MSLICLITRPFSCTVQGNKPPRQELCIKAAHESQDTDFSVPLRGLSSGEELYEGLSLRSFSLQPHLPTPNFQQKGQRQTLSGFCDFRPGTFSSPILCIIIPSFF